jgi:hypothetical protein
MKYFKLFVTLLASASFVSAGMNRGYFAMERTRVNGACGINNFERDALLGIIEKGDHPEEVVAAFNGCWAYIRTSAKILHEMIEKGRLFSFGACLSRIVFADDRYRDQTLNTYFREMVERRNWEFADCVLFQKFEMYPFSYFVGLPFSLEDMEKLIRRHPEHATTIAPSPSDFRFFVKSLDDGLAFVALARCCEEVRPGTTNTTEMLENLLQSVIHDEEMVTVAQQLLDMGAKVNKRYFDYIEGWPGYKKTQQLLRRYYDLQGGVE